ncbi:unnamed protein product [Caenorhabditis auriculariae]|uniref:Uncharacterized protein n=1 Tax=Caenorhabditis auriculariae TaxID=2777116 RepID=A0A8S1H0X3_9PELO|nr:unnamed protein product [Caenorhabditis auriculariae]
MLLTSEQTATVAGLSFIVYVSCVIGLRVFYLKTNKNGVHYLTEIEGSFQFHFIRVFFSIGFFLLLVIFYFIGVLFVKYRNYHKNRYVSPAKKFLSEEFL